MKSVVVIEYVMQSDENGDGVIKSEKIIEASVSSLLAKFDFPLWQLRTVVMAIYEGKVVKVKESVSDDAMEWKMWIFAPLENTSTVWTGDSGIPF